MRSNNSSQSKQQLTINRTLKHVNCLEQARLFITITSLKARQTATLRKGDLVRCLTIGSLIMAILDRPFRSPVHRRKRLHALNGATTSMYGRTNKLLFISMFNQRVVEWDSQRRAGHGRRGTVICSPRPWSCVSLEHFRGTSIVWGPADLLQDRLAHWSLLP